MEMVTKVKSLDQAFNLIHGDGASLNDRNMMDPVKITVSKVQKKCPDVNADVVKLFTKVKYFGRIKAINEKTKLDIFADRKRKAEENNREPKPAKFMRDHIKDGHFSQI